MSATLEKRVDGPNDATHVEEAWALKERIRRAEGVLKQRRGFFVDAYRRSTSHLLYDGDELMGFVSARRDGYILFLAVSSDARGQGLGRRLVAEVAQNHSSVTCHARSTNESALRFYEHVGFEVRRHIENYYEDGGNAYYLRLGQDASFRERLSEFLRR